MVSRLSLFLILATFVLIIIIIDLTRRRKLEEKISLMWISIASGLFVISFFSDHLLVPISRFMQEEQSFVVIIIGLTGILFLILALSIRQSKNKKRIISLAQEVAILKNKIEELMKK